MFTIDQKAFRNKRKIQEPNKLHRIWVLFVIIFTKVTHKQWSIFCVYEVIIVKPDQ